MEGNKTDLVERLTDFSVLVIKIAESLPNTHVGKRLAGQMIRSGISPALNYGEAQDAESTKDFIHKIKIVLKELRETNIALIIIRKLGIFKNINDLEMASDENNQLIAIFVASVKTAKSKKEQNN